MRFLLFDRIVGFEPGRRIVGVKCLSAAEDAFTHPAGRIGYPSSLILEAMVQLLAWVAIARHDFSISVVMAGVDDVVLLPDLLPGTRLEIVGELLGTNPNGSLGRVEARAEGDVVARAGRVLYGHVGGVDPETMRARFRAFGGVA